MILLVLAVIVIMLGHSDERWQGHIIIDTLAHCITVPFAIIFTWFRYRLELIDVIARQFARLAVVLVMYWLCMWSISYLGSAAAPLLIALFMPLTVYLALWIGPWMDRLWMPRAVSRADISEEFGRALVDCRTDGEAYALARTELGNWFETDVAINGSLAEPVETIRRSGSPPIEIELGYIRHKYPWFSEALALVRSVAGQLQSHIRVLQVQEQQQRQELLNRELAQLAAQAELSAMRAQIRPHFLFNVLHTIHSFIKEDPDKAEETIQLLADLMRGVVQSAELDTYSLADELALAKTYLQIEKIRFGDKLSWEISLDQGLERQAVPAFSLQPLIENAVKYSVDKQLHGGEVRVHAQEHGDQLVVTVQDNGPGLASGDASREGGLGVALQNIRERLCRLYGNGASLTLCNNAEGRGAMARLIIPLSVAEAGP